MDHREGRRRLRHAGRGLGGAAPQLARRLTSAGSSIDLVTSALVGAALLSIADLIAQHALPGVSLPVGAVTVSIGGLYLVWLLARETKTR
ncbi:iron chelate uptake ABC transporter family permease subunit [Pseudoclavibacter helvolus]|uniref:iron chelate uptake ABC transporter family permease subunit n=1 Tax=Pseudoclavibacter helvolus TaxID=255205 RepID=UPI003D159BFE